MPLTTTTTTAAAAVLVLISVIATATKGIVIPGLDTYLAEESNRDPEARNDSFETLPASLKKQLLVTATSSSLSPPSSLITSLLSLSLPFSLHIRLVGPSFPSDSVSLLHSFLSAPHSSDHFHVITPNQNQNNHRLSLSHSPHFDISLASPSLSSRVDRAISDSISSATSSLRSPLLSVPYASVDDVIRADFEQEGPVRGVFVYLIWFGKDSSKYAYSYSADESSPGVTKCLGTIWAGKERYLWIDLSAGPVDYGPGLSGDGVLPKGEFHPLTSMHGGPRSNKAALADLASLVWSAYQVLVVPPLRVPVHYESQLIVEFVHVYGSEGAKDLRGLDFKEIENNFMDEAKQGGLLLSGQSLVFKNYRVSYDNCSICSFAVSKAINSYTSRFFFDNFTLIVSEYLDSKTLHRVLSDRAEELRRVAGIPEDDIFGTVLPVYVFDLDYNSLLLLDRYHQSVSFRDMVIAVRTRTTQTVSDYSCNGRHVFMYTRDLERPIVGSILQTMWGVTPTHLQWSPRHNSTLVDYTWSVGHTPFGPFSESASLSFAQRDAVRRNVVLTSLNYSITSAIDVLESVAAHGGDRKLLKQKQHAEFVQRWNLFKYKLDKAISAMSHLDFKMAMYYVRSSDHDLYAMHSLVYGASQELEASLTCFKDPPFPWASVSVSAFALFSLLYVYLQRERLFRSKRKQF